MLVSEIELHLIFSINTLKYLIKVISILRFMIFYFINIYSNIRILDIV